MMSSPKSDADAVARYFGEHAVDFDDIYRLNERGIRGLRDRLSRQTVVRRLSFVHDLAQERRPRRVLDVGCGSGRFGVDLASAGAEVVGLDFAPDMIELARQMAAKAGVADRCTFLQADFLAWSSDEPFDLGLAVGVTDYVRDPVLLIAHLADLVEGQIVVSFPRRWHPLVPLRFLRLRAAGCPVYFYSRRKVRHLAAKTLATYELTSFGRDFVLVGSRT
jgi:2-polyprenyl-3-methyl-5-hydroxy-6-metoxy-1,4-benzoquinol methylase